MVVEISSDGFDAFWGSSITGGLLGIVVVGIASDGFDAFWGSSITGRLLGIVVVGIALEDSVVMKHSAFP